MFAIDDPQNQFLADMFGVVMGTSHQEPMMRSSPLEFNKFGFGDFNWSDNKKNLTVRDMASVQAYPDIP